MAEFKCLKLCKGTKEKQRFIPEHTYDLTVARVKEIESNIDAQPKWKGTGPYFERVDEPKKQEPKASEKKKDDKPKVDNTETKDEK